MSPAGDRSVSPVDVALGATGRAVAAAAAVARLTSAAARSVAPALDPVLTFARQTPLPERYSPRTQLAELGREGAVYRGALQSLWTALLDAAVPFVLAEVLRRANLTDVVLRYVDLDEVVAGVDLDRAVARVDLDRAVARVDLDQAVARVDIDAIIKRVDIDDIVAGVDLEAIIDRVDVDAVAQRLDIDRVLDRMDLTAVVLQRVDLDVLVQAILTHMDLIALAEEIIDGVDLSEIIRESTGTMASDTVQGVRMQGIVADDAISRAMDRFLLRHGRRGTRGPNGAPAEGAGPEETPVGGDALASPREPAP